MWFGGGLMAVWGGLEVVWGSLVEVWGGLGCFGVFQWTDNDLIKKTKMAAVSWVFQSG